MIWGNLDSRSLARSRVCVCVCVCVHDEVGLASLLLPIASGFLLPVVAHGVARDRELRVREMLDLSGVSAVMSHVM